MDLICYLHPGWQPHIRPAEPTRAWMDATPESFAYRCLPLNIANAHGWEILSPCDVEAYWLGGAAPRDVVVSVPKGVPEAERPVSLFGSGTLTFHVFGLFRTPPGWNLWVGGSPNRPKDAIQPLSGIIETDWSPYTFTMNWRFTRRGRTVRFARGEPVCHIFPIPREALGRFEPKLVPMESEPEVMAQFRAWSASRDAFQREVARNPPKAPANRWQKRYYRGVDMRDRVAPGHQAKLRAPDFVAVERCPVTGGGAMARLMEKLVAGGMAEGEARGLVAAALAEAGPGLPPPPPSPAAAGEGGR